MGCQILIILLILGPIMGLRSHGPQHFRLGPEGQVGHQHGVGHQDEDSRDFYKMFVDHHDNEHNVDHDHKELDRMQDDSDPQTGKTCLTSGCVLTSASVLSAMDASEAACNNFYRFACGSWIRETLVPEFSSKYSQFEAAAANVRQKVGRIIDANNENFLANETDDKGGRADRILMDLYNSCMDEYTIEMVGLEALVEVMGVMNVTMPFLDTYASEATLEQTLMSHLIWQMLETPFFGIDIVPNIRPNRPKIYNLLVYQPFLGLDKTIYENILDYVDVLDAYKFYLSEMLKIFAEYMTKTRLWHLPTSEELMSAINDIVGLEAQLAGIIVDSEDNFEFSDLVSFEHFEKVVDNNGKFDVAKIIQSVVAGLTGRPIKKSTMLEVVFLDYFKKLGQIIEKTDKNTLLNYLGLRVLLDFGPAASRDMRSLARWWNGFRGHRKPRWRHCVAVATHYMGAKVSQLYIDNEHGEEKRTVVLDVVDRIRNSFDKVLLQTEWMDKTTRQKARQKLKAMHHQIVRTHVELTSKETDKVYDHDMLELISNDSYVRNLLLMQGFWVQKAIRLYDTETEEIVDHYSYMFDTTEVNAFYSPDHNGIWVPLGLLSPPFFPLAPHPALLFGSLGAVIGHEMSHGFDNFGSKFDSKGNFHNWWSPKTAKEFEKRQECFVDQYNNISFAVLEELDEYDGPTSVNGENTLGENIADNVGLRQSLNALESLMSESLSLPGLPGLEWLSELQLFFLSFGQNWCEVRSLSSLVNQINGDVHAPSVARVHGVIANVPEFAAAFNCSPDQSMVKSHHEICEIW